MARLQKGELAKLRAVYDSICRLPVGKHLVVVEMEKGQAILKPEGGSIFFDVGDNRVTIVPDGLNGMVRVRRNSFSQNV